MTLALLILGLLLLGLALWLTARARRGQRASGLPRGRLVYADTFWEHDCVGLRGPRLVEVNEALGRA